MYCKNCGSFLEENASFCVNCGCRTNEIFENEVKINRPQQESKVSFLCVLSFICSLITIFFELSLFSVLLCLALSISGVVEATIYKEKLRGFGVSCIVLSTIYLFLL